MSLRPLYIQAYPISDSLNGNSVSKISTLFINPCRTCKGSPIPLRLIRIKSYFSSGIFCKIISYYCYLFDTFSPLPRSYITIPSIFSFITSMMLYFLKSSNIPPRHAPKISLNLFLIFKISYKKFLDFSIDLFIDLTPVPEENSAIYIVISDYINSITS